MKYVMKYLLPGVALVIVGPIFAIVGYNLAQTGAADQSLFGQQFGASAYKTAREVLGYVIVLIGAALALVGLGVAVVGPFSSEK